MIQHYDESKLTNMHNVSHAAFFHGGNDLLQLAYLICTQSRNAMCSIVENVLRSSTVNASPYNRVIVQQHSIDRGISGRVAIRFRPSHQLDISR
mmetsp:Transcript_18156/g.28945  ORF Transcript_18156/g.28945 Transcript_18156/m.28945 type:complete len:94 (+) Transcript_18156:61-342(+)